MRKIYFKVVRPDSTSICAEGSTYALEYKKGSVVKAPLWSLGIFCFDTRNNAKNFLIFTRRQGKIKRVVALNEDKLKTPALICTHISADCLDMFYRRPQSVKNPPTGTVCLKTVKVID